MAIYTQMRANMNSVKLNNHELMHVEGGISAAFLSAVVRAFTTIIDVGKGIGSSIRRIVTKTACHV